MALLFLLLLYVVCYTKFQDGCQCTKVILWCNGLRSKSKKRVVSDDERDDDDIDRRKRSRKAEEREDKVSSILKDLHGTKFTPMQLRI